MSTTLNIPNFDNIRVIPFTPEVELGRAIVHDGRSSLPQELKAKIDSSIVLSDADMQRITTDGIKAAMDMASDAGQDSIASAASSQLRGMIPDNILSQEEVGNEEPMEVEGTNRIYLTEEGLAAFASGDWDRMEYFEQQSQKDWTPLAYRAEALGANCFVQVEYPGKGELYFANAPEAKDASMWVIAEPLKPPRKFRCTCTARRRGFYRYRGRLGTTVARWLVPHLVTAVIGFAAFGKKVFESLVPELGIKAASGAAVFARGVFRVAGGLAAAIIVEAAFWGAWRLHALEVDVYVFDTENNWKVTNVVYDNAELLGGQEFEPRDLGRCGAPGQTLTFPGFKPLKQLTAAPTIHRYLFCNKIEIVSGLGVAMRFEHADGVQSGVFKFNLPRWKPCEIKLAGNTPPNGLEDFYKSDNWIVNRPNTKFYAVTTAGGPELTTMWNEVPDDKKSNPNLSKEYRVKIFLGKPTHHRLATVTD